MSSLVAFAYLISGVCFILALRGLSSPDTAVNGNRFGIGGMVVAIVTTLFLLKLPSIVSIAVAIVIGGGIGTFIAKKIQMTALPQLVAAFHSLVGLAAVLVTAAAFQNPDSFGIAVGGKIHTSSLIEMGLGVAIGAITFTGSLIAFAKLQGLIKGKPLVYKNQHRVNLGLGLLVCLLVVWLLLSQSGVAFAGIVAVTFALGFLLILPIGGADMPVVISMLNSYSGWAAAATGFTLENPLLIITGALVGASGAILSYIMCKAMNRSIFSVILGGFGSEGASAKDKRGVDNDRPIKDGFSRRRGVCHEKCLQYHYRSRLRHGCCASSARAA